jgi:hypothetical protein
MGFPALPVVILEPGVLIARVIDDELRDDANPPFVRRFHERLEIGKASVTRIDGGVVRDVVAVVAQRRGIERQQPQDVDAEILEVIQLLRQPGKVADPIAGAVKKRANVRLIDDAVFVPKVLVHF